MKTLIVLFNEPIHHICLMYGLRQSFMSMPYLNRKVLDVKGKIVTIDNAVVPPPMLSNPSRRSGLRPSRNMVGVSYWKDRLSVEYRDDMCSSEEITAFVQKLIADYLNLRHPFMKTEIIDGKCQEYSTGHVVAEIM